MCSIYNLQVKIRNLTDYFHVKFLLSGSEIFTISVWWIEKSVEDFGVGGCPDQYLYIEPFHVCCFGELLAKPRVGKSQERIQKCLVQGC